jgi:hypothetical protein
VARWGGDATVTLAAGDTPSADVLNDSAGSIVRRGNRTTSSSTTTTEAAVLRIDSVPVVNGRIYAVCTNSMFLQSSVAADVCVARIRFNTAGNATTASTLLGGLSLTEPASSAQSGAARLKYIPGATGNVSFLLSVARQSGTGNCSLVTSANSPDLDIWVEDWDVDPGDSGVDL